MPPHRVQLSRARGWRMPANTVKIDRTTRWGNPFKVGSSAVHPITGKRPPRPASPPIRIDTSETSIALYKAWLKGTAAGRALAARARRELKGKNLACWCRPGSPCHGDVLLNAANRGRAARRSETE